MNIDCCIKIKFRVFDNWFIDSSNVVRSELIISLSYFDYSIFENKMCWKIWWRRERFKIWFNFLDNEFLILFFIFDFLNLVCWHEIIVFLSVFCYIQFQFKKQSIENSLFWMFVKAVFFVMIRVFTFFDVTWFLVTISIVVIFVNSIFFVFIVLRHFDDFSFFFRCNWCVFVLSSKHSSCRQW